MLNRGVAWEVYLAVALFLFFALIVGVIGLIVSGAV